MKQRKYRIYCDMDGVLADFEGQYLTSFGKTVDESTKAEVWANISVAYENGIQWFENLPLMPDAQQLWDFILPHKPLILTATGRSHIAGVAREKTRWIHKHFGTTVPVIPVPRSFHKGIYASKRSILIDDSDDCALAWLDGNGLMIKHKNATTTIEMLQHVLGD